MSEDALESENEEKTPLVVPVTVWPSGSTIGQATLISTDITGIFFIQIEIEDRSKSRSGFMQFPMPDGFKVATVYVKDEEK